MIEKRIVADVGNTAVDIGEFAMGDLTEHDLPPLISHTKLSVEALDIENLPSLAGPCRWHVGSVNGAALSSLLERVDQLPGDHAIHQIEHSHFDLSVALREPATVGVDRLAAAYAANRLRHPMRSAIVVDAGTAVTIDLLSADGVFLGGMIGAGMPLAARNLADGTDQLPRIQISQRAPSMIGDNTVSAIEAGVFWMTLAGIEGSIQRLQQEIGFPCDVFATGGSMPSMLPHLSPKVQFEPHLVLSGLALAQP